METTPDETTSEPEPEGEGDEPETAPEPDEGDEEHGERFERTEGADET